MGSTTNYAPQIARGKDVFKAVGSGLNVADRAALHLWDALKAVVKPGQHDNFGGAKQQLLGTGLGRKLLWGGTVFPLLAMQSDPNITGTINQNLLRGQTPIMKNAQVKTATAADVLRKIWGGIKQVPTAARNFGVGAGRSMSNLAKPPEYDQLHRSLRNPAAHAGAAVGDKMLSPLLATALGGAGIGAIMAQPENTMGYQISKNWLGNNLWDRVQGDEKLFSKFLEGMGTETGKGVAQMGRGMLEGGASGAADLAMQMPKQQRVLQDLIANDDILQRANPEDLMKSYETLRNFAPMLATDPNAVKSFLREAATTGGGVDYAMIANLARAEQTVNPQTMKRGSFDESINIDNLMSKEALEKIRANGLHKLAAAKHGVKEFDLRTAVCKFGEAKRVRDRKYTAIANGIVALHNVM